VEQAGGKATDGHQRILDIKPEQVLISLQLHHFILDWNFINLDSKKNCGDRTMALPITKYHEC